MFRIKICGVTHRPDVVVASALGADAIGLNFFERSKRYLSPRFATAVAARAPENCCVVGVFVNAPAEHARRTFDDLRLTAIQLHGDESPEYVAELEGRPVIKAFRVSSMGLRPVEEFVARCRRVGARLDAILLDADQPGQYGGSGKAIDWDRLATELDQTRLREIPLVLAGGLTPDNVATAIRTVRPSAVDVASGVEYAPGRKDAALVDRFVRAATAAFQ